MRKTISFPSIFAADLPVNTDDVADHLWEDHDVSEVGLDWLWSLHGALNGQLLLLKLLDQVLVLLLEASSERSSVSRVGHVGELLGAHLQQVVEIDTSVAELLEGSSLLLLVSHFFDVKKSCFFLNF